jgi:hypothetical protein
MLPKSLKYLTVLKSPFKGLKLKFYFGDLIYGTPYNPKKFGIYCCSLGYSIKYPNDFFRYDYPPRLTVNLFKKQFVIEVVPNTTINCEREYWDAWWNYCNKTNKKESVSFRLNQLFDDLSLIWIKLRRQNEREIKIDYYPYILKDKYIFQYLMLDKLNEISSKIE